MFYKNRDDPGPDDIRSAWVRPVPAAKRLNVEVVYNQSEKVTVKALNMAGEVLWSRVYDQQYHLSFKRLKQDMEANLRAEGVVTNSQQVTLLRDGAVELPKGRQMVYKVKKWKLKKK